MKELQKYYAIDPPHEDGGECQHQCTAVYLASEADAAFAEMRREHTHEVMQLQQQREDIRRERFVECEALRKQHAEHVDILEKRIANMREQSAFIDKQHAEEIERLAAKLSRLPADWDHDSSLETWFPFTAEEVAKLRKQAERYEKLRRLNVRDFQALYMRNIRGEGRFDELVDQLPASGEKP